MKVKSSNLIYGLLMLGLPFAALANDEVKASARSESAVVAKVASTEDLAAGVLEGVMGTQPALEEALRETLRAWTDEAEAVHRLRIAGEPAPFVVLARN